MHITQLHMHSTLGLPGSLARHGSSDGATSPNRTCVECADTTRASAVVAELDFAATAPSTGATLAELGCLAWRSGDFGASAPEEASGASSSASPVGARCSDCSRDIFRFLVAA